MAANKSDDLATQHWLERASRFDEYHHVWASRWVLALNAGNGIALLSIASALKDIALSESSASGREVGILLVISAAAFGVGLAGSVFGIRNRWRLAVAIRDRLRLRSGVTGLKPLRSAEEIDEEIEKQRASGDRRSAIALGGFFVGLVLAVAGMASVIF